MQEDDFSKRPTLPGVPIPSRPAPAPPLPQSIGPYRIECLLNQGGMSRLYLGLHPDTHDPLVIKVLLPKYVTHPELKARFLQEAEVISLANHPNIAKLHGQGEWEGGLYIALEFIQGISLRQYLLQQTLSLKRGLEIVLQVADSLTHLHAHGVIHRDLKPENILITASGGIKVIDFGIAQLHKETREPTGLMGTPIYMSPEQRKDPRTVTPASDVYSLALMAYELALGRLSHGAVHISLLPKGLQPILSKALQPKAEDRYQTIAAFSDDLKDYLESESIERDQKGRGYSQDLAVHIRTAQDTLLPPRLPAWPKVEIGLAVHRELTLAGIYYDFLDLGEGRHGILLSEPSATGVTGILHSALLQGMVHALCENKPDAAALIRKANTMITQQPFEEIFTLNYLTLNPFRSQFQYLSCGYGPLWLMLAEGRRVEKLEVQNLALGIDAQADFTAIQQNWRIGDTLLLTTLRAGTESFPMEETLQEWYHATPQKQADAVLRRVIQAAPQEPKQRPLAVLSIRRIA